MTGELRHRVTATCRSAGTGSFGMLPPEVATPLALVLVELVQNAVEHGLAGRDGEVRVSVAAGGPDRLVVTVADDGAGLPAGFDLVTGGGLGLQIVRTLVEGELGGTLDDRAGRARDPGDPGPAACRRSGDAAGCTTAPGHDERGPAGLGGTRVWSRSVAAAGARRCEPCCVRCGA